MIFYEAVLTLLSANNEQKLLSFIRAKNEAMLMFNFIGNVENFPMAGVFLQLSGIIELYS